MRDHVFRIAFSCDFPLQQIKVSEKLCPRDDLLPEINSAFLISAFQVIPFFLLSLSLSLHIFCKDKMAIMS